MSKKILPIILIITLGAIGVGFMLMQNMEQAHKIDCPFFKLMQGDCAQMVGSLVFINHHISSMAYLTNYTFQKLYSLPLFILLIFTTILIPTYILATLFVAIYLNRTKERILIYKARFLRWMVLFRSLNPEYNLAVYKL